MRLLQIQSNIGIGLVVDTVPVLPTHDIPSLAPNVWCETVVSLKPLGNLKFCHAVTQQ